MVVAQHKLQVVFDSLFVAPFVSHRWATRRGRSHWVELEGWQNSVSGPLSDIVNAGGCEYVYTRDDWYFASVVDPSSLRLRLLEWHEGLAVGVERFEPTTPSEVDDLAFMRSVVGQMRVLIEQACVVEQVRWQSARQT
jgi:hypothetical protein